MSVTFKPTVMGALTGTLAIQSPQGNISVSLTGTGVAPTATFSAPSITFASQTVGVASSAQTINLQNTGNAVLSGIAISVTGTNALDFARDYVLRNDVGSRVQLPDLDSVYPRWCGHANSHTQRR